MLDIKYVKNNLSEIKDNVRARHMEVDVDAWYRCFSERSKLIQEIEAVQRQRKQVARGAEGAEQGRKLKQRHTELEHQLKEVEQHYHELYASIPNRLHVAAPRGATDADNTELKRWGAVPNFDFAPQDHLQLCAGLDLIDFDRAATVAGTKFYYLKNQLVVLELALIRYALDVIARHGYDIMTTPDVAKQDIATCLGFNPRGNESNSYNIEHSDLCLIATAEITLGGYFYKHRFAHDELPVRVGGVSHCFRREAGSAGKASKGLYRVHQFTKVELFVVTTPEQSEAMHNEILELEEHIFKGLEIPYRVVDVCSGELGAPAYRKFDIEAWMPGREADEDTDNTVGGNRVAHGEQVSPKDTKQYTDAAAPQSVQQHGALQPLSSNGTEQASAHSPTGSWGEITSASNCTDYQARRLHTKYQLPDGSSDYVHMLNGTAIATSRALVALLENGQRSDGSVVIPKVLHPYTNFTVIEASKSN